MALKFGAHIKELRIHLCQRNAASKGVRDFIEKSYVDIKTANPCTPILVRECSKVEPRLWARYEKGQESSVSLVNLSAEEVCNKLLSIIK